MMVKENVAQDLYEQIGETKSELSKVGGSLAVLTAQNAQLIAILKKALCYMFWIIVLLISTIIYGAIGADGFYAVRGKLAAILAHNSSGVML